MTAVAARSFTMPDESEASCFSLPFDDVDWAEEAHNSTAKDQGGRRRSEVIQTKTDDSLRLSKRNSDSSKRRDKRSGSPKRIISPTRSPRAASLRVSRTVSAPSDARRSPSRSSRGGGGGGRYRCATTGARRSKSPKKRSSIRACRDRSKSAERRSVLQKHLKDKEEEDDDADVVSIDEVSIDLEDDVSIDLTSSSSGSRSPSRSPVTKRQTKRPTGTGSPDRIHRLHMSAQHIPTSTDLDHERSSRRDHHHRALDGHSGHNKARRMEASSRRHSSARKHPRSHSKDKSGLSSSSHHKGSSRDEAKGHHRTHKKENSLGNSSSHHRRKSKTRDRSKSPRREHSHSQSHSSSRNNNVRRPSFRRVPSRTISDMSQRGQSNRRQLSSTLNSNTDRRSMMTRSQSERSEVSREQGQGPGGAAIDRRSMMKRGQSQSAGVDDSAAQVKPQPTSARIPRSERRSRRSTIKRSISHHGEAKTSDDQADMDWEGLAKTRELGQRMAATKRQLATTSLHGDGGGAQAPFRRTKSVGQANRNKANGGFAKMQLANALALQAPPTCSKFDEAYEATIKAYNPMQKWSGHGDRSKFEDAYDATLRSFSPTKQREGPVSPCPESLLNEKVQRMRELSPLRKKTESIWGRKNDDLDDDDEDEEEGSDNWMSFFRTGSFTSSKKGENDDFGDTAESWMKDVPLFFRTSGSAKSA